MGILERFKDFSPKGKEISQRETGVEEVIDDFEKWNADVELYYIYEIFKTPGVRSHSARAIRDFSKYPYEVKDRDFKHSGEFLSLLIVGSEDSEFEIELGERINYLGKNNNKKITLKGDAGHYLGYYMQGGEIIVEGSTGDRVGSSMNGGKILIRGNSGNWLGESMQSGEIVVEGSAGAGAGLNMSDGKILVKGNAGDSAGQNMRSGRIIIEGDAGANLGSNMIGGEIWVKGKIESLGEIKAGKIYRGKEKTGIYG